MAESGAGTELTLLEAGEPVDTARLRELYAYPDGLRDCLVRSNFIASVDGAATLDGRSGGLAGPGDRQIFAMLRALADVVMVGAGTVRAENYGGVKLDAAARDTRRRAGQAEVPPIAVVTRSGRLDPDMKVFTDTDVPPLVLTSTASAPLVAERLGDAAEVLDCSAADPDAVDPPTALRHLADRGLVRVLTEGGPTLHGTLTHHGLLHELCLTVAPVLVGGKARRITTGPVGFQTAMHPVHLLTDTAGYLYTRYAVSAD